MIQTTEKFWPSHSMSQYTPANITHRWHRLALLQYLASKCKNTDLGGISSDYWDCALDRSECKRLTIRRCLDSLRSPATGDSDTNEKKTKQFTRVISDFDDRTAACCTAMKISLTYKRANSVWLCPPNAISMTFEKAVLTPNPIAIIDRLINWDLTSFSAYIGYTVPLIIELIT